MSKFKGLSFLTFVLFLVLSFSPTAFSDPDTLLSLNVKDSPMKGVLELIATKAGLQLVLDQDPSVNITIAESGKTARQLLEKLSTDQQIEFSIIGNQLFITKRNAGGTGTTSGDSRLIRVHHALASELMTKLFSVLAPDEKLLADERENNLVFIGSKRTFDKLVSIVALFDRPPKQIMIEAQIVETSHQFLQDIGISLGDLSDRSLTNTTRLTGYSATPGPTNPTLSVKAMLSQIDTRALDLRLTAAETKGDAKVISRPKVITLNNKQANIQSGISYSIRTLASVPSGGGAVAGGVSTVSAGLSLNILPTLVGDTQIRMIIDINNSQPDEGAAVDGIPGILKNAASTSVIVGNKQTAIIAGLIKQSKSKSNTGVPFLSDIPILGMLFQSHSKSERNNELVIFITPTIDDSAMMPVDVAAPPVTLASPNPVAPAAEHPPITASEPSVQQPAADERKPAAEVPASAPVGTSAPEPISL